MDVSRERILAIAQENFAPDYPIDKDTLISALGDSLDMVKFCIELETEYTITIPDTILKQFDDKASTIGNVMEYLEGLSAGGAFARSR